MLTEKKLISRLCLAKIASIYSFASWRYLISRTNVLNNIRWHTYIVIVLCLTTNVYSIFILKEMLLSINIQLNSVIASPSPSLLTPRLIHSLQAAAVSLLVKLLASSTKTRSVMGHAHTPKTHIRKKKNVGYSCLGCEWSFELNDLFWQQEFGGLSLSYQWQANQDCS